LNSGLLPAGLGVPQGSILDPLPFFIYVNDISNLTREDNIKLLVDDTNLPIFGSNELELTNKATLCTKSMCKKLIANKLSLSVEHGIYKSIPMWYHVISVNEWSETVAMYTTLATTSF
jgi:hypothetical protein